MYTNNYLQPPQKINVRCIQYMGLSEQNNAIKRNHI